MALSGGVGKWVAAVVGVGLIGASVWAFRVSRRTGFELEAAHEASLQLPLFASAMARCAVARRSLPATSGWVPARLAEVSAKPHVASATVWEEEPFACAGFKLSGEQRLQYRWRRNDDSHGRVEVRADFDGDGAPDHWLEVNVDCPRVGECQAVNYVTEVLEDGTREPPSVLTWLGRARRHLGEPPSLTDEVEPSAPIVSVARVAPPPLPAVESGVPSRLDTLHFEAERRALAVRAGVVLLEADYQGVSGALLDPGAGGALRSVYGSPDRQGLVRVDEDVVEVTFGPGGVEVKPKKARRPLHAVGLVDCLPERLLASVGGDRALRATLAWDSARERASWTVRETNKPPRTFSAERCAAMR